MARKTVPASVSEQDIFPTRLRLLMDSTSPRTSQETLAQALGITRQAVSNYKSGQSSPDWKTIVSIAKYFGVSSDYLLGITDVKSTDVSLQAVCKYVSLDEHAVRTLHKLPSIGKVLREIIPEHGFAFTSSFDNVGHTLMAAKIEHEKIKPIVEKDPDKIFEYFPVYNKHIEQIELALFRFERVCRDLPEELYKAKETLNELNSFVMQVLTREASNGEYQED